MKRACWQLLLLLQRTEGLLLPAASALRPIECQLLLKLHIPRPWGAATGAVERLCIPHGPWRHHAQSHLLVRSPVLSGLLANSDVGTTPVMTPGLAMHWMSLALWLPLR